MDEFEIGDVRRSSYEIFFLLLAILSFFNLFVIIFSASDNVKQVAFLVNLLLSLFFLIDFFVRLHFSPDKKDYFLGRGGWLDMLAGFPIPGFNLARIWRFYWVWRMLRHAGSREIIRQVAARRADTALIFVALAVIYLLEFGSIFILKAEAGALDANIRTADDALWWIIVTIATVGYGDKYPVTNAGRFVAIFIIFAGVGVFGTLSGYLANSFLGQRKNTTPGQIGSTNDSLLVEIKALQDAQNDSLEKQEEATAKLHSRLEHLEELLRERQSGS